MLSRLSPQVNKEINQVSKGKIQKIPDNFEETLEDTKLMKRKFSRENFTYQNQSFFLVKTIWSMPRHHIRLLMMLPLVTLIQERNMSHFRRWISGILNLMKKKKILNYTRRAALVKTVHFFHFIIMKNIRRVWKKQEFSTENPCFIHSIPLKS